MTEATHDFIRKLPKAELHLHLEGTVEPKTLVELSARVDETPISVEEAHELYDYSDFSGFIAAFISVARRLIGPDEYELIAHRMIESLAKQGVVHAEVYLSIGELLRKKEDHISDSEMFEKIIIGLEKARSHGEREHGVTVYWLIDSSRHEGTDLAKRVFQLAADFCGQYPSIIGIGLGGDERVHASEPFRDLYREAGEAKLRLTNHAGENTPAHYIWEALSIGSERLGHAYSAIQDPLLVDELRKSQVPLELNPSSNVRLGNCPDFKSHPLRALFDAGLLVTLNSDDPGFFGSSVENEYRLAHSEQDFTRDELRQLAINSFKASFLPSDVKTRWIDLAEALE